MVNLVTRRPEGFEMDADAGFGEYNMQTATVYLGDCIDDHLTASLTASFSKQNSVDNNGNLVSEYTGFTRMMGGLALFDDFGDTHAKLRLDYINEKRGGGANSRTAINANLKASLRNVVWRARTVTNQ